MNVIDSNKRLWVLLGACVMLGFLILGFFGREVYRQAPPIPERIVAADGTLLATRDDILTGQTGSCPSTSVCKVRNQP